MAFTERTKERRQVLVVDDQFINREILGMILEEDYDVLFAENGVQALEVIRERRNTLSIILLDLMMPEMDGFTVIEHLHADEELKSIPIIVLTAEKSAELRSLQMGAADFITKPFDMHEVILARVGRIIEMTESRQLIQSTERDPLTGLYNASYFYEFARQLTQRHPDWSMDAVVLNIERFHLVNEMHGREFGDRVLRLLAERVRQFAIDRKGLCCRVDADAYYVYCEHQDEYDSLIDGLQTALSELSGSVIHLRLGAYPITDTQIDIEQQFDRAKTACNTLRGNYMRSVLIYSDEMRKKELYRESLVNDLPRAIEQKQLKVFYQPKYDIRGDEPVLGAAEALVRWQHPEYGMVSPGDFIPLFESNGLIQQVDYYVWRETAAQLRRWKEKFGVSLAVSMNLSRIDIYDPELEQKLIALVEENGLETKDLHLEVTESAYSDDQAQLIAIIERLRERGFLIEMDDFGSGYSSLNTLTTLPFDIMKLDMKFIQNVHEGNMDFRMIELILDIAEYMKVPVVAEGVETAEQCRLLKDAGCALIQGYYFSRPVPPDEFEKFFG